MKHSIDYFRDEVREGFYIPTAIKQAWAVTLDVLAEIDRICERYGIRYFADWGTFLGAVRHGGFVPWDDDLDICMLRDDYIRFRSVADEELPEHFVIHDYERQETHRLFLVRVVNNARICFEEDYLTEHYNFPWLAGVDIFLKDYLYDDPEREKERDDEVMQILALADGIMDGKITGQLAAQKAKETGDRYGVRIPAEGDARQTMVALYRLAEEQMARVAPQDSNRIGQIFPWVLKGNPGEPKERYAHTVRLPFEDTTMPVPGCYNSVLEARYGNYMEIHKVWGGHDYPFFEGQRADMERIAGAPLGGFVFDGKMLERPVPDKSVSFKTTVKECLSALRTFLTEARASAGEGDAEAAAEKLAESQQLAVDLGTLTEQTLGAENPRAKSVVASLEAYCEAVFRCHEAVSVEGTEGVFPEAEDVLQQAEDIISHEVLKWREILFLPVGAREWHAFADLYHQMKGQADTDVSVVPLPLLVKDPLGRVRMTEEEIRAATGTEQYPADVICTPWQLYDVTLRQPDVIYIQNPYDAQNPYLTVPPDFYAERLRRYTDCLIYRPIAKTAEFGKEDINDRYNMKHYVTAPGVVFADCVEVQSENIRAQYIDVLTAFAGEDTRATWEGKVRAEQA